MARPKPDKDALLAGLAAHVLDHGLTAASLRPMAASVGTSDRMLIYHFGSKDALIAEVLVHLARTMASDLDRALPEDRFPTEAALVQAILQLMRAPAVHPYIRLWFDIVSASGQGEASGLPPGIGQSILGVYLDWIARRHPKGDAGAPRCLALVEGLLVMEALECTGLVDRVLSMMEG